MIASEYGYTIKEFSEITFREIDFMLKKIQVRRHEAYRARAALHGLKVKPMTGEKEKVANPKRAEEASKLMKEALEMRKADSTWQTMK